ncbi:MAG: ArsR/SmtB family transcription factor [Myxococcaceae bacterium]
MPRQFHNRPYQSVVPGARFDLVHFGELIGDASRAAMLLSLMDGQQRPASEMASLAGVSASTASIHLRRLVEGGLLSLDTVGRHRFFRIANEQVAHALEVIALRHPRPARAPAPNPEREALEHARTCYRHLAGLLGVLWMNALERQRLIEWKEGVARLSPRGMARFSEQGLQPSTWPEGKPCLDWTERRNHLGGPLGTLLTEHLFDLRWIARGREGRSVRVTSSGRRTFEQKFGMTV